jgi:hypothetical protein
MRLLHAIIYVGLGVALGLGLHVTSAREYAGAQHVAPSSVPESADVIYT